MVAGASRGIGLATARLLLAHGAQVRLTGGNPSALDRAIGSLDSWRRPLPGTCLDTNDRQHSGEFLSAVKQKCRAIDFAINSAKMSLRGTPAGRY